MSAAPVDGPGPEGRTFVDATPAQIRSALTPEDAESFDRHWRTVMQSAIERLDLTEVHEALRVWRQTAMVTSAHGVESHRLLVHDAQERLRTGRRDPGARPWREVRAERGLST